MTRPRANPIRLLATGVAGLDSVLGGGLPEYSFNLIAGGPGAGKTTLAQQIAFARATTSEPALYFTVLGEPPLKMLRHVQQFSFFDEEKFNRAVRFVNLSAEALGHDLDDLLKRILGEVESVQPGVVIVDSFRTVAHASGSEAELQGFVQRLALHLTGWQATTFLVGEYEPTEAQNNPIFTIADGILWLTQTIERSACVRRLQVTKMRGANPMPGLHALVTSSDGLRIFPRLLPRGEAPASRSPGPRASTGVPGLDAMMSGGVPAGESALVVGPSGSGKSTLARQFIAAGAAAGERGVIAVFEQHPGDYVAGAEAFGPPLADLVARGLLEIVYLRPLDLTVDEALAAVRETVERTGARRVVVDSLSGFELALAPSYRDDFRQSLFRLVTALTGLGVTVLMLAELAQSFTDLGLSSHITDFFADVMVLQRYVELDGKLEKVLTVVKMRNSRHDTDIRRYTIDGSGVVVGERMRGYRGVLRGAPVVTRPRPRKPRK